jgi:hypothetical protein
VSRRPASLVRTFAAAGAVALAMASFAAAATPRKTTIDLRKTKTTQTGNQVHLAGTILPRAATNPKQGAGSIAVITIAVNGKKVTPTSLGNAITPAPNGTFVYKAIVGLGPATYKITFTPPFNGKWRKSTAVVTVTMTG